MNTSFPLGAAFILLFALVTAPASAAPAATQHNPDLLDTLHNNHTLTDAQYQRLKKQRQHHAKQQQQAAAKLARSSGPDWPAIYGYAQVDFPLSVGHANKVGSRTTLRRFYLYVHGTIAPHWVYQTAFGYNNGHTYFNNVYMAYSGFDHLGLKVGYYKGPFSLGDLTAPKNLLFAEYPLPVKVLIPGKAIGATVRGYGKRWSLTGGIFGGSYTQTAEPGGASHWGTSLRGTWVPWQQAGNFWEAGASLAWREADSHHKLRLHYRPESYVVGLQLADTQTVRDVSWYWTAGAETLLRVGPVDIQAEYIQKHVARNAHSALSFPGWYVQSSWSLTGEHRRFSKTKGKLGGLSPRKPISAGGLGAWELATRYSATDLNNAGVSGGFERNASVGVNWYPEKPLKFMLDGIRVFPVRSGLNPDTSTTIVMLRAQAMF